MELREKTGKRFVVLWNELLRIKRIYPRYKSSETAVRSLQRRVKTIQAELRAYAVPSQLFHQHLRPEEFEQLKIVFMTEEAMGMTPYTLDDVFPDILRKTRSLADIVLKHIKLVKLEVEYVYVSYTYTFISTGGKNKKRRMIETRFEFVVPEEILDDIGYGTTEPDEVYGAFIPLLVADIVKEGNEDYHGDFIYAGWENEADEIHGWKKESIHDIADLLEKAREAGISLDITVAKWKQNKIFPFVFYVEDHDYNTIKMRAEGWLPDKWWELPNDDIVGIIAASLSSNICFSKGPQLGQTYAKLGRPKGRETQLELKEVLKAAAPPKEEKIRKLSVKGKAIKARIAKKRIMKEKAVEKGKITRAKLIRERLKKKRVAAAKK